MIALIKTFTLQPSAVSEQFHGTSSIISSSFALAYGGYGLGGVILDKKLEKTKVIRQK